MPLLRFTKLLDQVKDHRKTQTMRIPRKNPMEEGDTLHIYVLEKLGTAKLTSKVTKKLRDITLQEAIDDGFVSIVECQQCLMEMHKCTLDEEFDIIKFDPGWEKQTIIKTEIAGKLQKMVADNDPWNNVSELTDFLLIWYQEDMEEMLVESGK